MMEDGDVGGSRYGSLGDIGWHVCWAGSTVGVWR